MEYDFDPDHPEMTPGHPEYETPVKSVKRPDHPTLPSIQTLCNCTLYPTHMTGEQLLSCRHQRWKVKAREVVSYAVESYTESEATIQQAAMVARTLNGELSGV